MQSENSTERAKDLILDASLGHAPFDGWSALTFQAALADSGVAAGLGAALFPRGGIDLAVAYHQRGDAADLQAAVMRNGVLPQGRTLRGMMTAEQRTRYEAAAGRLGLPVENLDLLVVAFLVQVDEPRLALRLLHVSSRWRPSCLVLRDLARSISWS